MPALEDEALTVKLWPFEGTLTELLQPNHVVVTETYPGECYDHLGVEFSRRSGKKWGKRVAADRRRNASALLRWAERVGVALTWSLVEEIENGFGEKAAGEDPFDAVVGLFGMLNVVLGHRAPGEPTDALIRSVEGWILGQMPA